jgi:hypothetical protein
MKKAVWIIAGAALIMLCTACNHGLSDGDGNEKKMSKRDRSQRTVIDNAEYVDFTVKKHNAQAVRREDVMYTLNGGVYKNGNSSIKIKANEGIIEIASDSGRYNNKENCQIYGVYGFEIQAASEDCLYLRKNPRKEGYVIIDNNIFRNDAIPDLAVCLPLYGYSKNRIEVSPVMDGYIVMPSGTYWKSK